MFCYRITNKINGKKYIGITTNFDNRVKQHCNQNTNSLIHKAIQKYGKENFVFEILQEGLSVEEAEELEIETIKNENTLAPHGYNLAKGGLYGGTKNKISDEQVKYIKDNRDKPVYLLYEKFSDLICYGYFLQLYRDEQRKDIVPSVEMYPNNLAFSCQFTKSKMTYEDIVELREAYATGVDWKTLYPKYKDKVTERTFWDIFTGKQFLLIMPEVFTPENKSKRTSNAHKGEKNSHAKLTEEDVIEIRRIYKEGQLSKKEISKLYPQVSYSTVLDVINYRSWKHI